MTEFTAVRALPPLPPAVPRPRYPRWRAAAHALLDRARMWRDRAWLEAASAGADAAAVVHAEALADPEVFPAFERLCRLFLDVTGTRMLACVIPGSNPIVRGLMAAHGLAPERFLDRVRDLADVAVIGYHGHFFLPAPEADAPLTPMRHGNFDEAAFRRQLEGDRCWFEALDLAPAFYTGGWWVLNRTIAAALEAGGVRYDFTLRPSLRNTFAEPYDVGVDLVDGRPFRLTGRLWELGSFAGAWRYPVDAAAWRRRLAGAGAGRPFCAFYFHDFDVLTYRGALERTFRLLARMPALRWVALDDPAGAGLP